MPKKTENMSYNIVFSRDAEKQFKKLPKKAKDKIAKAIFGLAVNPLLGEKLHGELEGKYKIKVWPYRIIYQIFHSKLLIVIVRVQHRQGAYK